jgi:maleylpyruvate isomerase
VSSTLDDARRWTAEGTELFLHTIRYEGDSELPGWTRRHLIAHVAANADALGNLVAWAASGEPTPMYPSSDERAVGIERGAQLPETELGSWLHDSAARLEVAMDALTEKQWSSEVVTAQDRTVPATTVPWLRAREVCVHAVDLGTGVAFADLAEDFLEALAADVTAKRGAVPDVDGPLNQRVAWLTGRPHLLRGAPELGPWL